MATIPEEPDNDHQAQESDPGSGSGSEEKARESEHHEEEKPDLEAKESDHHDDDNPEMEKRKRPVENHHEGGCDDNVSKKRKMGTLGSENPSGSGSSSNQAEEPIEHRTDEQRSCANDGDHGGDVNNSGGDADGGHDENGDNGEYENGHNGEDDDYDNDHNDDDDDIVGDAEILQGLQDYIAANQESPTHKPFAMLNFVRNWLNLDTYPSLVERRIAELKYEYVHGELSADPELLRLSHLIWGHLGPGQIVSSSSVGSGCGPSGSEGKESGALGNGACCSRTGPSGGGGQENSDLNSQEEIQSGTNDREISSGSGGDE